MDKRYYIKCRHCACLTKGAGATRGARWYCDGPHKWGVGRFHNVQPDVLRRCHGFTKRKPWQKRVYIRRQR